MIEVYFTDSNNGWAVGGNVFVGGTILATTNGGNSWTTQTSGLILGSVYFTDSDNGWVVGYAGRIFKTTDGGKIWTDQSSGTTDHLSSVYFTDSNTGWAVGSSGTILKTNNGGNIWTIQSSGTTASLGSVYFTDSDNGWVVGYAGTIIKTTDGGKIWTHQSSGTTDHLSSVHFTDSNTGWMVGGIHDGNIGIILKTTDGGNNWTIQTSGTTGVLNSVYFTDSNTGWVVGHNGTILHTTNGGVTFIEGDKVNEIPTDFSLLQNYPNPFNPSTTIKYELPNSSVVRLSVYDVLGREVSVLVDERRDAGVHEVKLNASGLASGVYFCRLQARKMNDGKAEEFIQTKQLMLLK